MITATEPHHFFFPENEVIAISISTDEVLHKFGAELCHNCTHWDETRIGASIWECIYPCGLQVVVAHGRGFDHALIMADQIEVDHIIHHLGVAESTILWRVDDPNTIVGGKLFRESRRWEIWREDDNANQFVIGYASSERSAICRIRSFEDQGHKQTYFAKKIS